jgi:hypothetical protein
MASIEEIIVELKSLPQEQVDEVARIIHALSQTKRGESSLCSGVPAHVIDNAVQHGWPAELFTELIGSLPDLERAAQPPVERRSRL